MEVDDYLKEAVKALWKAQYGAADDYADCSEQWLNMCYTHTLNELVHDALEHWVDEQYHRDRKIYTTEEVKAVEDCLRKYEDFYY